MERNEVVKRKNKTNRGFRNEYLLDNIIDEELQAALFPLTMFQSFFLVSRFRIIDNFIIPDCNVPLNYAKSFIGSIVLISAQILRYFAVSKLTKYFDSKIVLILIRFIVIFVSLAVLILFIVSFIQRHNHVDLIIKMQRVLNQLKIDKKAFLRQHKFYNWVSVLTLIIYNIFNCLMNSEDFAFLPLMSSLALSIPPLVFDIQIVNVICVLILIQNELVVWNCKLEEKKETDTKTDEEIENGKENHMFNAYVDIMSSFCLCNNVYKFSLAYFGIETFAHILVNVEYLLEVPKSRNGNNLMYYLQEFVNAGAWNTKNFVLIVILSITCNKFYKIIEYTEKTCALVLKECKATGMRNTCKNVMRLNRAAQHKLSAFGVFEIDASFPMRLLSGIVAYTVVLLQFAFL